jgi:hypothetical protein
VYEAYLSADLGRQFDYTAIIVAEEGVWVPEPPELDGGVAGGPRLEETTYWDGITRHGWRLPSSLTRRQRDYFRARNYAGERPDRPPLMIRHVERVRGVPYPQVVAQLGAILARPPLADLNVITLVDSGGVGLAVSDFMWQEGIPHVSITATGGDHVNVADGGKTIRCPKRELVAAGQVALAQGRLRIAAGLEHAPTLTRELESYRVTISQSGHDSYSARENEHDELVYAACQLCWYRDWLSGPTDDAIAAAQRAPVANSARASLTHSVSIGGREMKLQRP